MKHLIIGFCAAGANAAEALRRQDPDCEITVLNGDSHTFYLRLNLEGVFEDKPIHHIQPRTPEFWVEKNIQVINDRAVGIDHLKKQVVCQSGAQLGYDKLLIATGATPRRLNIPGEELHGIFTYHSLEDAQKIYDHRPHVKHCTIIGGGILGLEFARCAHEWFNWEITLLIRGDYCGSGTVDAAGGPYVLKSLEAAGVEVLFHEEPASFEGAPTHGSHRQRVSALVTRKGRRIETDFVAKCIGVEPSVGFLKETPLLTNNKLIVNDRLETPVESIYAAGDVAVVQVADGRLVHCNTWNVALDQARTAAANMLGKPTVWKEDVLYNLDALFTLPLAVIGQWEFRHQPGFEVHDLSTKAAHRQIVVRNGRLVGAVLLGDRSGDRRVRKLIARQAEVIDKFDRIFNPDTQLEEFVSS